MMLFSVQILAEFNLLSNIPNYRSELVNLLKYCFTKSDW